MKKILILVLVSAVSLLLSACAGSGMESAAAGSSGTAAGESAAAGNSGTAAGESAAAGSSGTAAGESAAAGSSGTAAGDTAAAGSSGTVAGESDGFETALRFLVTSDTHISTVTDTNAGRLARLLRSSYAYAETAEYKAVDALVVVGDMTNYGQVSEYKAFKTVVNANIREETQLITVMGNHEFYGGTEKEYIENIDAELNKHVVIDGYHFIGISTKGEGDYSEDLEWLKTELAAAAEADPDKPIITFQHHHIKDTVYVSSEWYAVQSAELNDIYSEYSRVLNFSGHSHGPINHPGSVFQSDYTLFGTGTLAYFEMTSGMSYGTIPPNADQAAQFYIVEVSEDHRVRVLPYNLLTDDFFKTPDGSKQLVYEINDLKDKSAWLYTASRKEGSAAPAFGESAAITVDEISAYGVDITFPQATDDECVYSYNIICTPAQGKVSEFNYFSEYYFEPMPETLTFTLSGLIPGTDYTLEVYPVDVFGIKGEAVSADFTTGEAEVYEYISKNPVTFTGTFTNFDSVSELKISGSNFAYGGKVNGDVFAGDWASSATGADSHCEITAGGYNGSAALAVWSDSRDNQGLYIFGTADNGNTVQFPSTGYLRVWVDFTGLDFRKANFGLVSATGALYTTDESDYVPDLEFMYLAEGSEEWVTYYHGSDGCFGVEQASSVQDFKGWLAFPAEDFTYRAGTGSGAGAAGEAFPYNEIAGVYMFWNYSESTPSGTRFILDEIQLVEDYAVFEEYGN